MRQVKSGPDLVEIYRQSDPPRVCWKVNNKIKAMASNVSENQGGLPAAMNQKTVNQHLHQTKDGIYVVLLFIAVAWKRVTEAPLNGLPAFNMVGLPETSKESRGSGAPPAQRQFRISGQTHHGQPGPPDLPRRGRFDLAIAIGILAIQADTAKYLLDHEFLGNWP